MIKKIPVTAIIVFYIIAVSLRYVTEYTFLASHLGNKYYKILTGIGPAIGAIVASKLFGFKIPLTLKGNFKILLIPFSIYWLLPILLISVYSYITTNDFSIILCLTILVYGLFEEIGWRGFLQPALKPLPKFVGILVLTILWYVWHLNFGLDSSHFIFFGILLLGSWGIGLVANKTNSLLAVASFHSLNNFYPELDIEKAIILIILITIWITTVIYFKTSDEKTSANINIANSGAAH